MQSQGWPEHVLRWTPSFPTGRLVQVHYLDGVTSPKELFCGVPKGSPISPLLFLLYMAEPMRSGNMKARFSYADDVRILGIRCKIRKSAEKAQQEVDSLLDWAQRNAVLFEAAKSEVIQFPGPAQEESVRIRINGNLVQPAEHIRWLGVHLDQKLSFKHHVTIWCSKALKTAQHMRRLYSVKRGAALGPLVTAVNACIVPVANFGAEVWWPGLTREITRGTVTPATSHFCNLIDKAVHLAIREVGIPPAWIILEGIRLRLAARLNFLDNRHPLRTRASLLGTFKYKRRAKVTKYPGSLTSRVQRAYRQLSPAELAEPLPPAVYHIKLGTKAEGVEAHSKWVSSVSPTNFCAYLDGSSVGHGRSSWGFILQQGGVMFEKGRDALHGGEVYDTEIVGNTAALRAAIQARRFGEKIFILLDNQAAVHALQTGKSTSCLQKTRIFHHVASKVNAVVRCVPGHSKITGNEEADVQARAALQELPAPQNTPEYISLAYLRRLMYQRRQDLIDGWWSKVSPARYKELDLQMRRRKPPQLHLSRRLLHGLLAARIGHGDFAAYHRRFHHEIANLECDCDCDCGFENSPTHFFRCRKNAAQVRKLRKGATLNDYISQLLGPQCVEKFTEFARETGCFGGLPAY
ncbi:hypothetical protein K3495_g5342 [Podosphaera aphanis]|nr:hypothetical protein K3495_g5342 [Podosphaera aphanis]